MKATFISIWDSGVEVSTLCEIDVTTRCITEIEQNDVDGLEILEEEHVEFGDGHRLRVLNFEHFKDLWIKQECDKTDDKEQLVEELSDCNDYDDLFKVIGLWSHKPLIERVKNFLEKNNACYYKD